MRARLAAHPLAQLTFARLKELLREPEAIFWVFVFPLLLAVVLALAFPAAGPGTVPVGVLAGEGAAQLVERLAASAHLEVEAVEAGDAARALRTGRIALLVEPGEPPTYRFDPTRPESLTARLASDDALQAAAGRQDAFIPRETMIEERGQRYVDFLVPGLIGMTMMGTAMWAIGFALVQARGGQLLKRFIVAPMRRTHFLGAQMLSRGLFLVPEVGLLVVFAVFVLGVPFRGSLASFVLVCLLGGVSFVGLGLLVAARPRTIEGASGLMNLVMVPMWIFSGIFFSTERFPDAMQPFVQALPLTALNDALRGVMLEGSGLAALGVELAILALWGVASFAAAVRFFQWQ